MKNTVLKIAPFIVSAFFYLHAFSQTPHLSGNISLSVKKGTIKCDLLLSDIPAIKDYMIWLNAGLNMQYLRDSADKENYYFVRTYNDQQSGESFQYYIPDGTDTGKTLHTSIRFAYTGAFSLITDTAKMYDRLDWKGNIAFDGNTARATEQSAWYPVLYDKKNDIIINKYTYNINVTCEDCNAVYINGDAPKTGNANQLSSSVPVPLFLFAGNYVFEKTNDQYFINTGLLPEERNLLSKWTNSITDFYEKKLQAPYGKKVSFISAKSVAKSRAWMFVTYPSIVSIEGNGFTMHKIILPTTPITVDTSNIAYIAHELGHYYYGTLTSPNAELRWFFLEGVTEFLSLKYVQQNLNASVYKNMVATYFDELKELKQITPISAIKSSEEINYVYQYRYIPLLLTALEKQIGEKKIWAWLSFIAKDKNAVTNYSYFKSSLLSAGVGPEQLKLFEDKFITSPDAKENVIKAVKG